MSDFEVPFAQLAADLVVAIIGSAIAVLGALWIADRTFKRDVQQDRRDRRDEELRREQEQRTSAEEERWRILVALLSELNLNINAVDAMSKDTAHLFPLRRDALDLALAYLGTMPTQLGAALQSVSMFIDRYNALDAVHISRGARLRAVAEADPSMRLAATMLAGYLRQLRPESAQAPTMKPIEVGDLMTWADPETPKGRRAPTELEPPLAARM